MLLAELPANTLLYVHLCSVAPTAVGDRPPR